MATGQPNAGDALTDLPSFRCVNLTIKITVTPGEDPQEETSVAAVCCLFYAVLDAASKAYKDCWHKECPQNKCIYFMKK